MTWLRSVALRDRWLEECKLVTAEMGWTVNYFNHCAIQWMNRKEDLSGGHRCYAARQQAFWKSLADRAADRFNTVRLCS